MTSDPQILTRMELLLGEWLSASDQRLIFLSSYRLMTENVLAAVSAAEFNDPDWVDMLLHRFAGYYFGALETYERHQDDAPAVWRIAFDAAGRADTLVVQHLMLGINAHINYDLVLTLVDMLEPEWEAMPEQRRLQRYEDHCYINDIIGGTIDTVQDEIIEPHAPAMDIIDKLLGPLDEWVTSHLISHWREEVWQSAQQMMQIDGRSQREHIRRQIESTTLDRAEMILRAI